jgi:hypothetical protein
MTSFNRAEALIWVYGGNGGIYECDDYSGTFTSGVPKSAATKVQARMSSGSDAQYGGAVDW